MRGFKAPVAQTSSQNGLPCQKIVKRALVGNYVLPDCLQYDSSSLLNSRQHVISSVSRLEFVRIKFRSGQIARSSLAKTVSRSRSVLSALVTSPYPSPIFQNHLELVSS